MRNLAFFLLGFLVITVVAIVPEIASAATAAENQSITEAQTAELLALGYDIYLLLIAITCVLAFGLGFIGGQQR